MLKCRQTVAGNFRRQDRNAREGSGAAVVCPFSQMRAWYMQKGLENEDEKVGKPFTDRVYAGSLPDRLRKGGAARQLRFSGGK